MHNPARSLSYPGLLARERLIWGGWEDPRVDPLSEEAYGFAVKLEEINDLGKM
jgi:hypothetical protein